MTMSSEEFVDEIGPNHVHRRCMGEELVTVVANDV
jgi:hypothetical protein